MLTISWRVAKPNFIPVIVPSQIVDEGLSSISFRACLQQDYKYSNQEPARLPHMRETKLDELGGKIEPKVVQARKVTTLDWDHTSSLKSIKIFKKQKKGLFEKSVL